MERFYLLSGQKWQVDVFQHLECVINQASLRMNARFSTTTHSKLPIAALIDEVLIFETRFLVTDNVAAFLPFVFIQVGTNQTRRCKSIIVYGQPTMKNHNGYFDQRELIKMVSILLICIHFLSCLTTNKQFIKNLSPNMYGRIILHQIKSAFYSVQGMLFFLVSFWLVLVNVS